jgi:hypothetical protein
MNRPFWHRACRAYTGFAVSSAFQVPIRTAAKRTRLPSITPWHFPIESIRSLSLRTPDVSQLRRNNKFKAREWLFLTSSSLHHPSSSGYRARMTSRRPYSTKETGDRPKLANGSSSARKHDDHKHIHEHDDETPPSHSHSLFGHSHSHGEEGHSHGTEQIIAALEGSGTSETCSNLVHTLQQN